jgi:hypothetical protein
VSPIPPATVPLAGFPNLSAAHSSLRRPAIFRQVALLGFTLQGFVPLTKPRQFVTAGVPSWRSSRWTARALVLGESCPRACRWLPRMLQPTPFVAFRVSFLVRVDPRDQARLVSWSPICPSWACASPWFAPPQTGEASAALPSRFTSLFPSPGEDLLRSTACCLQEPLFSYERSDPSQGFSPSTASPVLATVRCGPIH